MGDARESVGDRIRIGRIQRGLSRANLAGMIGVSEGTVQGWENGTRRVRDVYLGPLARALNTTVSELSPSSEESIIPGTTPMRVVHEALGSALSSSVELLEDLLTTMSAVDRGVPPTVAMRLKAIADRAAEAPSPDVADLMTQAEAAANLGVSRQAIHRLVAEGRVKAYPNPARPDRAPMVSLAEVRALVRSRPEPEAAQTGGPAPDGPSTAEKDQDEDLKSGTRGDDTKSGVIPMSPDPTTPPEQPGDSLADPPWFADEFLIEEFETTSAAFTGQQFRDRPKKEREVLVREHREALRKAWRRMTPERRAELLEKWRRRHP